MALFVVNFLPEVTRGAHFHGRACFCDEVFFTMYIYIYFWLWIYNEIVLLIMYAFSVLAVNKIKKHL